MKFLISIFTTSLLAFACGLYLPWWTVAVAAFVVAALILQPGVRSFLSGFLGIFLLWILLCWMIDSANSHVLAPKVAAILPLNGSVFWLIIVTALIGGLVGGMAALTGSTLRRIGR